LAGSGVKEVDLSASEMQIVPAETFCGCRSLETLLLSPASTALGDRCCEDCAALKAVDLAHVISVGDYAFRRCSALAVVTFGEGLEQIGRGAFEACALKGIKLSANLESVGEGAFAEMALDEVELTDAKTKWGPNVFTRPVAKVIFRGVDKSVIPVHLVALAREIAEPAPAVDTSAIPEHLAALAGEFADPARATAGEEQDATPRVGDSSPAPE
jgi:hypothetical protein